MRVRAAACFASAPSATASGSSGARLVRPDLWQYGVRRRGWASKLGRALRIRLGRRLGSAGEGARMFDGVKRPPDPTLAGLTELRRWVAWRPEPRGEGGKSTKVPYSPE